MENLGERLKQIRTSKSVTLNDIAKTTQLSVGYLSKVERNINNPTIQNLQKICTALQMSINDLFAQPTQEIYFSKQQRVPLVEYTDVKYETASSTNTPLRGSIMTVQPNAVVKTFEHAFDEIGLVLSGSMEVTVSGKPFDLEEGDTIFVPKGSGHCVRNKTDVPCVSYWVKGGTSPLPANI